MFIGATLDFFLNVNDEDIIADEIESPVRNENKSAATVMYAVLNHFNRFEIPSVNCGCWCDRFCPRQSYSWAPKWTVTHLPPALGYLWTAIKQLYLVIKAQTIAKHSASTFTRINWSFCQCSVSVVSFIYLKKALDLQFYLYILAEF